LVRYLYLAGNQMNGTFPDSISVLTQLSYVNLANDRRVGADSLYGKTCCMS
jgi:hypothetical protein